MSWKELLTDRLLAAVDDGGAWGYRADAAPCAEPTALAALALSSDLGKSGPSRSGLEWLAKIQHRDGSLPVSAEVEAPGWPTPLAILAWMQTGPVDGSPFEASVRRAVRWLIAQEGVKLQGQGVNYAHDGMLVGWPWVKGTHSWVEPTAYGILALKACGMADHPRVREGVRVLVDRIIPSGGLNYGNKRVLANVLRPFPAPTGTALCALHGLAEGELIDRSIRYLCDALPTIRAPLSLSWGIMGLTAWGHRAPEADAWLEASARRVLRGASNPLHEALLLLAAQPHWPLVPEGVKEAAHA